MSDDRRKILEMLATGRITAEEAERLLDALGSGPRPAAEPTPVAPGPKYLRIEMEKTRDDHRDPEASRIPALLLGAHRRKGRDRLVPDPEKPCDQRCSANTRRDRQNSTHARWDWNDHGHAHSCR